ncbi:unnamed protein product, partial [Brassica oleracea var. botrytis]|uniref:Uncharacterized protein n=2 Tax=Brassica oleracea TaxID=3712 RepID=A0A0D3BCQ5_BRAOL
MIVEDERDGYTQFNVSEFQQGEDNGSSHVDLTYSTDIPTNIVNTMGKGLATALQLADPFSKTNQTNDVVFLRIATHPKGRKMLTKYVELLLAVFRHLRFLFGGLRLDANLANQLRLT